MSFVGSQSIIIKDLSGNIVPVQSGIGLNVNIAAGSSTASVSGETIAIWNESGRNQIYLGNQGGSPIEASNVATDENSTNNIHMRTAAAVYGFDTVAGNRWRRIASTTSGAAASQNGAVFRLLTDTVQAGSNIKTGAFFAVTGLSGGAALAASGVSIHGIKIKNFPSGPISGTVYVGSSGNPPYVSGGYPLAAGEETEFKVFNPAFIRVFAVTSGTHISWAGVNF